MRNRVSSSDFKSILLIVFVIVLVSLLSFYSGFAIVADDDCGGSKDPSIKAVLLEYELVYGSREDAADKVQWDRDFEMYRAGWFSGQGFERSKNNFYNQLPE